MYLLQALKLQTPHHELTKLCVHFAR
jgi:hypothetical protein